MGDLTDSGTPNPNPNSSSTSRPMPIREDCWSEEATATLVDSWGNRYLELNRGNLRQKDWKDVADTVNSIHGLTKKTYRTDVQCKNRIDTIKKKYKVEKTRVTASNGALTSSWRFFDRLDSLIGSNFSSSGSAAAASKKQQQRQRERERDSLSPSPPVALPLTNYRRTSADSMALVTLPQKRPAASAADEGYFRRNYSAMAAAAAAAAAAESESEEEEEEEVEEKEDEEGEGVRRLARAIERFGEVYERVESDKLRQMVDLEKQRMKFAKDLEMERMRIFTETQIQLEKIKKGKRSGSNGERDY
ncbi:Trihelix transcription factor ENAP2 [Linum perenne]